MGAHLLGVILALFIAGPASAQAARGAYNISPTAVTGSARNVALGGAMVANPDGYTAVFVNPAALAGHAGTGLDFGSDSNMIDNAVIDLDNPKAHSLNDPVNYSYYGARYASRDGWGVGLTVSTPFSLDNKFSGTRRVRKGTGFVTGQDRTELKVDNMIYTLGAGRAFLEDRLALGLAVNYIQGSEAYDFQPALGGSPIHEVATNDAFAVDFGVLAKPRPWLQAAAAFKMGYQVAFDPARNQGLPATSGASPFRDCKVPDRFAFGLVWMPHDKFRLYAQGDYAIPMRDGLVVASGLFPGESNVLAMGRSGTLDGRWGAELIPIDEPDLTFKLWAGGYYEDTGVQGGYRRYHRTAGFGLSPWFLSLNMAIDDTEYYNNFVVGLGIDILQVASRVAKTYGWKLPL